MDDLTNAIRNEIEALPHVHDLFRTTWFAVKERLENMKDDYISYEQYVQICEEEGVEDELSQKTLIGFLNDLGIALHHSEDPRLEHQSVLKPEWVTNAFYSILISRKLTNNNGVLHWHMLRDLLPADHYPPRTHLFIIDMMKRFELCYEFEGPQSGPFLVPHALPERALDTGRWDDALNFEYHYRLLFPSIFSRFMVRMRHSIVGEYRWRTGVLLAYQGNEALVRADLPHDKISIAVRGQSTTRRDLLSQITVNLEAVHASLTAIRPRRKIPISGAAEPFDFDFALKLEAEGKTEYMVPALNGEPIRVDLLKLLGRSIPADARRNLDIAKMQHDLKYTTERVTPLRQARVVQPDYAGKQEAGREERNMTHAFISYVRENEQPVDRLAQDLRKRGVKIWLDRDDIDPGQFWKDAIRKAIQSGDFFIACFSRESCEKAKSYMNEELFLAIEELRLRPHDQIWFVPVLLSECGVPAHPIGGGRTLKDIQWVPLHEDWERGIERLAGVLIRKTSQVPTVTEEIATRGGPILEEALSRARSDHPEACSMPAVARRAFDKVLKRHNPTRVSKSSTKTRRTLFNQIRTRIPAEDLEELRALGLVDKGFSLTTKGCDALRDHALSSR